MNLQVRLIDLIKAFSSALDLVSRAVADHHVHVGYLSARLGERLGLDPQRRSELLLAALLHDAGAISMNVALEGLDFERDVDAHARAGAALLSTCPRLARASQVVLLHHVPWRELDQSRRRDQDACIIHLADRADVQFKRGVPLAEQAERMLGRLEPGRGWLYASEHMDALRDVLLDPATAEGLQNPGAYLHTGPGERPENEVLDTDGIIAFSNLFSLIIDWRSPFTATHSTGVAETSRVLARWLGFSPDGAKVVYVAGLLHDIGKLGVPLDILEKPASLTAEELVEMQLHARRSLDILGGVPGLEQVALWGGQHHERLDGTGYPHGRKGDELDLATRIVAVADVFTAITEDRPYRKGMPYATAMSVLRTQARDGLLDGRVVEALLERFDEVDDVRRRSQTRARQEFDRVLAEFSRNQTSGVDA